MSYAGQFNASEVAVNESDLVVYRCSTWNYVSRSCSGSFAELAEYYIVSDLDRVIANTTGFSSFILTASTCGNSVCQSGFGETTSTCSADCPAASSGSSSSSTGGGGGGGSTPAAVVSLLRVVPEHVESRVNQGDVTLVSLLLNNTGESDLALTLKADTPLSSVLSFDSELFVPAHSSAQLFLLVNGSKVGSYTGLLHISDTKELASVPILILVKSSVEQLLDVGVTLKEKRVAPGETLNFQVATYNLGSSPRYDIFYRYELVSLANNKTIEHFEESVALQTSLSLARTMQVPLNAARGSYVLRVLATYNSGNSTALASATVEVGSSPLAERLTSSSHVLLFVLGFLLVSVLVILFILFKNRGSTRRFVSRFQHRKQIPARKHLHKRS